MPRLLPLLPFIIFFALATVFYLSIGRDTTLAANGMVGKPFPNFQLQELVLQKNILQEPVQGNQLQGTTYDRAALLSTINDNKPWLLNVWASWCPQCYIEHGFIEAIAHAGGQVVGLNYKDEHQKGIGFLQKMGNPYHLVLADTLGTLGLDLGVSGAPETYLVGGNGQILVRHAGVLDRRVWDQKFAPLWQQEVGTVLFAELEVQSNAQSQAPGEGEIQ